MTLDVHRQPWLDLSTTAPSLPGGADKQVTTLISLLRELDGNSGTAPATEASERERIQKQIGPLQLTRRIGNSLEVTPLGRAWLAEPDLEDLFRIFHSRIAYFGEMLATIADTPVHAEDLRADAVDSFGMTWDSMDQVRRRLSWLHAMGLVEDGPKRLHRITALGKKVLSETAVETADSIRAARAEVSGRASIDPAPPAVAQIVASSLDNKRSLAAPYLTAAPVDALTELALEALNGSTKDAAVKRIAVAHSISESSAKSFVDSAGALGLYEYTGKVDIRTTALGVEWLQHPTPLNFVRILHTRYFGVGELLQHLDETPRSSGEIHTRLFGASSTPKPNRTTAILRHLGAANAVASIGFSRYVITELGKSLREELPLEEGEAQTAGPDAHETHEQQPNEVDTLITELEEASRDSANPDRFEQACAAAFEALGVEAQHLGGPGRTDVLVTIKSSLNVIAKAIVDAKSASGQLAEGSIKFDALKEHAAKHDATLMAVVAPSYEGSGRLRAWAQANDVVLLTASELGARLRAHHAYPFSAEDVKDLLTVGGKEAVDSRHLAAMDHLALVTTVMRELSAEAAQPVPEPVAPRDIGRIMRRGGSTIADDTVSAVLELLSQPAIGAVGSNADGLYTLPSAPRVAATRLRALARAIEESTPPAQ
ncbi:restriction endonuclease [Microbacterium sp. CR_7]|uniref:restriction endonuclease n=1 Tax=Microbacterium sp. CR_7 TaxID=3055792 RepID=UPI0035C0C588